MSDEAKFFKIMWDKKARGETIKSNNPLVAVDELNSDIRRFLAHIDENGIYRGTLTADQINTINGITLGPNATIDFLAIPGLTDRLTSIDAYGIYTGTLTAEQIYGLLLEGVTIKAGKIIGLGDSAILEIGENGGSIDTERNPLADLGKRCSIRLKPGTDIPGVDCGYLQVLENGELYLYTNDNQGQAYASVRHDGFYLGSGKIGSGSSDPINTTIQWATDGLSFTETEDGTTISWTVTKNASGKITSMVSSVGDNLIVNY